MLKVWMEKDWDRMLEIVFVPFTLLGLSVWIEAEISSWQEGIAVTQMVDSYFTGSNIGEVDLEGAILDYAKWSDGRVCVKGSIGICK
jgi:hypothetical protein